MWNLCFYENVEGCNSCFEVIKMFYMNEIDVIFLILEFIFFKLDLKSGIDG